jgi:cysteine peptidase C11 family protein
MPENREKREWTLMFYLASDNPLAPGVVSQLKAIKAAGFHKDANVIVQFDPYTQDTPTHVFDVNIVKKALSDEDHDIGFESDNEPDPWVYNLFEDKLWGKETDRTGNKSIRQRLKEKYKDRDYNPADSSELEPTSAIEPDPKESLGHFLNFCATQYPADHYMLFILGHGLAVGTEVFLFDEHAQEHFLPLPDLRDALKTFNSVSGGPLELVSFHSCSVSSLEVAFELAGCANYMLASQGNAFVGSWPYRQILMRIFKDIKANPTPRQIESMLGKICDYCVHNSTDFLLAGYPFQICLCNLKEIGKIGADIQRLAKALMNSLTFEEFKDSILLAHLKSQSFHQEQYTDICDFCRCLWLKPGEPVEAEAEVIRNDIQKACADVAKAVKKSILRTAFAGPEYQYAKGLSVYFPWSQPLDDVWDNYKGYEFNHTQTEATWAKFLEAYFGKTMRDTVAKERENFIEALGETEAGKISADDELLQDEIAYVYTQAPLQLNQNVPGSLKTDKGDPTGDGDCSCPSIKNYPRDTRARGNRAGLPPEKGFPSGDMLLQQGPS